MFCGQKIPLAESYSNLKMLSLNQWTVRFSKIKKRHCSLKRQKDTFFRKIIQIWLDALAFLAQKWSHFRTTFIS